MHLPSTLYLLRCALLAATFFSPGYGALITFTTRAAFNIAAPGLPTETFESGLVSTGGVTICNGPLSSAVRECLLPAGTLLAGVIYSASGAIQPNMVVLGANVPGVGNTGKVVGPNFFLDTLNVTLSNANAVGFDVFPGPAASNVAITIFSSSNVQLGMFAIPAPIGGTFFGVVYDADLIGRIHVANQSALPGELIDNLSFGIVSIAEPGSFLLLAGALSTLALIGRRNRFFRANSFALPVNTQLLKTAQNPAILIAGRESRQCSRGRIQSFAEVRNSLRKKSVINEFTTCRIG